MIHNHEGSVSAIQTCWGTPGLSSWLGKVEINCIPRALRFNLLKLLEPVRVEV